MPDVREQSTYLFFTGGGSDKEYHAHLRERFQWGESLGWVVDYANGKRGHVGQSKSKTPTPLAYEAAKKIYDDLVKSKKKDGYTEAESGVRFTNTDNERAASGHEQQLCVSLDASQIGTVLTSSAWGAQQKANGERRTVRIQGDEVRGINKLGLYVNIPETWVDMRALGNCLIDGEQVGTTFYAFDLLEVEGQNLRNQAFEQRFARLADMVHGMENVVSSTRLLALATTTHEKQKLLARLEAENHEGLVFKLLSGHYTPGRDPNSLKHKFTESSTCCVLAQNQKRSVQIGLLDEAGRMVPVGNVTIPGDAPLPAAGALVEVQYLYFNPGGAFEQPVYLGVRNDILPHEATLAQVTRYKPVDGESLTKELQPALQAEQARILASGTGQEAYFFVHDHPAADWKAIEARILEVGTGGDAFRLAKLRPEMANLQALEGRILSVGNEVDAWNFATTIQGSNARALYQYALSCPNGHLNASALAEFAALADLQDAQDSSPDFSLADAPAP